MTGVNAVPEPFVTLDDTTLGHDVWIRAWSALTGCVAGDEVFIGYRCRLGQARLGSGVMVASGSVVGQPGGAPVELGDGCWVGARAIIDPGVRIGAGTVVAAGAHVTTDVADNQIVIGRPPTQRVATRAATGAILVPVDTASTIRMVATRPDLYQGRWPAGSLVGEDVLNDADVDGPAPVEVGAATVAMGRRLDFAPTGGLRTGCGVRIGRRCVLECTGGLTLGDGVVIGDDVLIVTSGHDYHQAGLPRTAAPVTIGARTRIGRGATLVGPLNVGADATIKPGHLVVTNIPEAGTSVSPV